MEYRSLFVQLISDFLDGKTTRRDVAREMASRVPLDSIEGGQHDLMPNCEWGLRHINEPDFWTTQEELAFYLACLVGEETFSVSKRDKVVSGRS